MFTGWNSSRALNSIISIPERVKSFEVDLFQDPRSAQALLLRAAEIASAGRRTTAPRCSAAAAASGVALFLSAKRDGVELDRNLRCQHQHDEVDVPLPGLPPKSVGPTNGPVHRATQARPRTRARGSSRRRRRSGPIGRHGPTASGVAALRCSGRAVDGCAVVAPPRVRRPTAACSAAMATVQPRRFAGR